MQTKRIYLELGVKSEKDVHSGVDAKSSSDRDGGDLTIVFALERSGGVALKID